MGSQLDNLVRECLQGDQVAWRRLVELHTGLVIAVARRRGLRTQECEEVAQHAFMALFKHLNRIADPQSIPSWLITTTSREAVRVGMLRRRAGADAPEQAAAEALDVRALEEHHRVRTAVEQLGPKCRELIRCLFYESPPPDYEAIGQRLGMPVGSIGPNRARCLANLAKLLVEKSE